VRSLAAGTGGPNVGRFREIYASMKTPSHDAIAQRARQIWQKYGSPSGRDPEIWFEAERQLAAEPDAKSKDKTSARDATTTERLKAETAAESIVEHHISPPIPQEDAIKAALQKQESRAPIAPSKTAPKPKPPETGKPLWDKPHSS
jgi:hypothetical protein